MLKGLKRIYPFNAEQTVNILSEFGPLVTMFIVNAAAGINAGTWALLTSTVIAMVVMRLVLGRFPVFPLIASSVTVLFGVLTLVTNDPMWVQIKVTIFNALFAGVLFGGLQVGRGICARMSGVSVGAIVAAGVAGQFAYLAATGQADNVGELLGAAVVSTGMVCVSAVVIGFLAGAVVIKRNFFEYVFEKTFHYSAEGWDRFTFSFAWFFMFTAVANEAVRLAFPTDETFAVLGRDIDGVSIWILFKILVIMPVSGLYAWYLSRLMQKHRLPDTPIDSGQAGTHGTVPGLRKDVAGLATATGLVGTRAVARSSPAE